MGKQCARNRHALPHATRKRAHQRILALAKTHFTQQLRHAPFTMGDTEQFCEKKQVLLGGQFVVHHRCMRNKAHLRNLILRSAGKRNRTASWPRQVRSNPQERGFARTIPACERYTLARSNCQCQVAQRIDDTVPFVHFFESQADLAFCRRGHRSAPDQVSQHLLCLCALAGILLVANGSRLSPQFKAEQLVLQRVQTVVSFAINRSEVSV